MSTWPRQWGGSKAVMGPRGGYEQFAHNAEPFASVQIFNMHMVVTYCNRDYSRYYFQT